MIKVHARVHMPQQHPVHRAADAVPGRAHPQGAGPPALPAPGPGHGRFAGHEQHHRARVGAVDPNLVGAGGQGIVDFGVAAGAGARIQHHRAGRQAFQGQHQATGAGFGQSEKAEGAAAELEPIGQGVAGGQGVKKGLAEGVGHIQGGLGAYGGPEDTGLQVPEGREIAAEQPEPPPRAGFPNPMGLPEQEML